MRLRRPHRPVRTAATAGGVALVAVALALPASAASAPPWPADGYTPSCDDLTWNENLDAPQFNYTDTTEPVAEDVTLSTGNPTVLGPGQRNVSFQVKMVDTCSGVAQVEAWLRRGSGVLEQLTMSPATENVFDGYWGSGGTADADDAGRYELVLFRTRDRYDSFALNGDFRMLEKADALPPTVLRQMSPRTPLVILRQTQLALKPVKSPVPKGKPLKLTGVVKFARASGYVAYPNATVTLQFRNGTTGNWSSAAPVKSNASGVVTFTAKPSTTAQYKLLTPGERGSLFTAPGESPVLTVTVK
ncbi:MAG: hypothetical protein R2737_09015 [Candidatus Nanopelagicales bacterium]